MRFGGRRFVPLATFIGVLLMSSAIVFLQPAPLIAGDELQRNDLSVTGDAAAATGSVSDLLDFAHVSDIHIVDNGNKLRFDEVLSPLGLGLLDPDYLDFNGAVSRAQDDYTAAIWNAVVSSINDANKTAPLSFLFNTGDNTDTDLENEFRWCIEISDGYLSKDYYNRTCKKEVYNFAANHEKIEGLKIPWYAALGNHDVEYQGTVNHVNLLARGLLVTGARPRELQTQQEAINAYLTDYKGLPHGHGFANMPEPQAPYTKKEGYYSFDPTDYIHCVVLNTCNYRPERGLIPPKETLAKGVLDQRQFDWMKQDIEANAGKLCIIFAHHPAPAYFGEWDDNQSAVSAQEFMDTLLGYPNVIATVDGHTHYNHIEAVKKAEGAGGYWDINTCSVIEWPQEWRRITVRDNGDGTGSIICHMVQNTCAECLKKAEDNLTQDKFIINTLQYSIPGNPAPTVEQKKTALEGTAQDRDVELLFAMPAAVAERLK